MLTAIAILLALFVLPSPWGIVAVVVGFTLDLAETLFFWGRWRGRKARVGVETFLGRTAVVVSPLAPAGQVKLDGELWRARSGGPVETGTRVIVTAVEGLTLLVRPVDR